MKKLLLLFAFTCAFLSMSAQGLAQFELQPNGTFAAEDGKNYIVVPFEGKSAMELFNMVKNNVMSVYKSPKDVMSENEGQSISIRGYGIVAQLTITLLPRNFGSHYNLLFNFKDNKIRVEAPTIDNDMVDDDHMLDPIYVPSFGGYVNKIFNKDGSVSSKMQKRKEYTEATLNTIINALIAESTQSKVDEDW